MNAFDYLETRIDTIKMTDKIYWRVAKGYQGSWRHVSDICEDMNRSALRVWEMAKDTVNLSKEELCVACYEEWFNDHYVCFD